MMMGWTDEQGTTTSDAIRAQNEKDRRQRTN